MLLICHPHYPLYWSFGVYSSKLFLRYYSQYGQWQWPLFGWVSCRGQRFGHGECISPWVNLRTLLDLSEKILSESVLSSAWWISERTRPPTTETPSPFYYTVQSDPSAPLPTTFVGRLTTHPVWIALSADIFMGQIIASLIVLTFVAVFLLREWISQNARPGVFEDEEVLPDEQPAAQVPVFPPPPLPQVARARVQAEDILLNEGLAQRQMDALRAIDALRARDGVNGHIVGDERHHHGRSPLERPKKKGKTRQRVTDIHPFETELPARNRRKLLPKNPGENHKPERDYAVERKQRQAWFRRVQTARVIGARRRAALAASGSPPLKELPVDPLFEFTFTATPQSQEEILKDASESGLDSPEQSVEVTSSTAPIFPSVTLEPPRATIPFSFDQAKTPSSPGSPVPLDDADQDLAPSSASSLARSGARRPPLPTSSLVSPRVPSSNSLSPEGSLDSPSLATYRAPEELDNNEAGPSSLASYFEQDEEKSKDENGEEGSGFAVEDEDRDEGLSIDEFNRYFAQESEAGSSGPNAGLLPLSDSESDGEDDENKAEDEDEYEDEDEDGSDDEYDMVPSDGPDDDDDEEDEEDDGEDDDEGREFIRGALFANDLEAWNAAGVQGDEAPPNGVALIPGGPAAGEGQGPVDGGVPLDLNDELEGNVEDDMEGAMEGRRLSTIVTFC